MKIIKQKYPEIFQRFIDNVFKHDCILDRDGFKERLVENDRWVLDPNLVR